MAVFGNPWLANEKHRVDQGLVLLAPTYALMFSLTHPQCPYPIVRTSRPPGDDRRFLKYLTAGNYLKLIPTCPGAGATLFLEEHP